jgi:hypothetical protein
MKKKWLLASIVSLLSIVCALNAVGQNSTVAGQYVISAKAGGVNYVDGKVSVMRKAGTSGLVLTGDEIQIGDKVTTGEDGRVEVLLNPGSYLRVGAQSSFEFTSTDLENLRLNLRAGSAVFEVYATNEFRVSVKLPQSDIVLNNSGVFRIDVLADGSGRVSVFKGETLLGKGETKVGSGRVATVTKTGISVAKFDRDTKDPLDVWAKARAKELTSLNGKLRRDALRDSLLSSYNQRGWNLYGSFGLWVFDSMRRSWFFLPFGYGWSSPYGWDYGYDLWRCRMPWYVWNDRNPTGGSGGGGGGTTVDTSAQIREERRVRTHTPPFARVQETRARSEGGTLNNDNWSKPFPSNDRPVSSPPIFIPSAPPVTAPIINTQSSETKGRPGN